MYKSRRTIFGFLLALVLILGVLPEFHVRAEDNSQTYMVARIIIHSGTVCRMVYSNILLVV